MWSKIEIKGQIWHENVCPDSNFTINILLNHLVHMLNCSDIVKRESMGMGGLFFFGWDGFVGEWLCELVWGGVGWGRVGSGGMGW